MRFKGKNGYCINFSEQQFLEFMRVIRIALQVNEAEMNALFKGGDMNKRNLLDLLLHHAKSLSSKAVAADLVSLCSSITVDFDVFTKLETIFDEIDNELGDELVKLRNYPKTETTTITTPTGSAVVFSPYGGVKLDEDLRFVGAEAIPNGTNLLFPSRGNNGPTNYLVLDLNRITGKVAYLSIQ